MLHFLFAAVIKRQCDCSFHFVCLSVTLLPIIISLKLGLFMIYLKNPREQSGYCPSVVLPPARFFDSSAC